MNENGNENENENNEFKMRNKIILYPIVKKSEENRLDTDKNIDLEKIHQIKIYNNNSKELINGQNINNCNNKLNLEDDKEVIKIKSLNLEKNENYIKYFIDSNKKKDTDNNNENNDSKNKSYNDLVIKYFDNQLIDENYVKDFNAKDTQKIANSIMYKKYIINTEDQSDNFKDIFNHMFCSFKLFKCFLDCFSFKKKGIVISNDIIKKDKLSNLKYQNFWNFGLNLIFFEVTGFFLISQVIMLLSVSMGFSNGDENANSVSTSFEWQQFYSNQYKCIQLELDNLLDENYSLNISCFNNKNFFYISKFGISPYNEEGENIAGCFASSFKNLISIDSDCDLTQYLDDKLREYKYQEANITINVKEMNIKNEINKNCNNKNQRKKFFLSYSCYIPYIKKEGENKKRKDLIEPIIYFEALLFFLNYLSLFYNSSKFYQAMRQNNLKNLTLMIDTLDIKRKEIPTILNEILISIKNKLISLNIITKEDSYFPIIKEINYSFINSDEKELYDKFNFLLRKKEYLKEKIDSGEKDKEIPRNLILTILSKICKCLKKTYQKEYEENDKELEKTILNILEKKDYEYSIYKIYITFSKYEIKSLLKNEKILIGTNYHTLKKSDMSPHDINWENLNVTTKERLYRRILSYLGIVVLILVYFLIVIIISLAQNTFQRKYNLLLTDCSNVDYKNNHNLIYDEYMNKDQNDKEKIYTYCYCKSNSNFKKISYNNMEFDPCITYNKYKFQRTCFIYLLSVVLCVINLFINIIVDKIISIQKFESKSNQKNLNIIITIIILIFINIVSVVLINAKIKDSNISSYFGIYEDITPQWINEMSENILANLYLKIFVNIGLNLIYIFLFAENRCCHNKPIYYYILFLTENPIIHFYNYFRIYAPEKDFVKYSTNTIFFIFNVGILIIFPFHCIIACICLMIQAILILFQNSFLNSFTYVLNKLYFKINFSLIVIFLIFHTLLEMWWFSSEYFFIDISENIYDEFYGSNKDLIDKFLKGDATISEKIKLKLILKRNSIFILQLIAILVLEIIRVFYCQNKKTKEKKEIDENLFELDDYSKIKYYELYKLLYTKITALHSNNDSNTELFKYLEFKYNEYKDDILKGEEKKDNYNDIIMEKKNKMIEESNVFINNPDFTFSPFLLDQYSISYTSKLVLSNY